MHGASSRGYQFAAYFFAGLFLFLRDPTAAFTLYLYMITGDMVGNLMVFVWAAAVDLPSLESRLRGDGGGGDFAKVTFFSLAALSFLAMWLGLAGAEGALEAVQRKALPLPTQLVFCTFLFGAFSKGGLEGFCPQVVRARLLGGWVNRFPGAWCLWPVKKMHIRASLFKDRGDRFAIIFFFVKILCACVCVCVFFFFFFYFIFLKELDEILNLLLSTSRCSGWRLLLEIFLFDSVPSGGGPFRSGNHSRGPRRAEVFTTRNSTIRTRTSCNPAFGLSIA